jgi:hypothetical protein
MIFNYKKSLCCQFGLSTITITSMKLGDLTVERVNSLKYLSLTFISDSSIKVDYQVTKRKFYAACNSVLSHSRRNNELVKLQLIKSSCLPLLTYCLGAIEVPRSPQD